MVKPKVAIIGAGNVAWHLTIAFSKVANVKQVCSRKIEHAFKLADQIAGCSAIESPGEVDEDTDLCLIAVSDAEIANVSTKLPGIKGVVAHTSGSVGIEAVSAKGRKCGVFYPLQTFSKDVPVDISQVPFFTEANSEEGLADLDAFVRLLGAEPEHADSRQRRVLHLAAVLSCNFANHLWAIASDILKDEGYSIRLMYPLLQSTLDKAMAIGPGKGQTGPARRNDLKTVNAHLDMLEGKNKEIYRLLTESIITYSDTNNKLLPQ